jgi:tRNA U34 2-thiouridine synthase MnmA/TrmU
MRFYHVYGAGRTVTSDANSNHNIQDRETQRLLKETSIEMSITGYHEMQAQERVELVIPGWIDPALRSD